MRIKHFLSALCLLVKLTSGFSQNKDFGVWYGGNVSHDLFKKVGLDLGLCLRTDQNASHVDQFFSDLGIGYKFNKYISLSASYRWILKDETYKNYFSRHRFYSDLKLSYPIYNFKLSTRFRAQSQYKQYAETGDDKLPDYYGRIKAQVVYNWPFFPIDPYVSAEWFYPLNNNDVKYSDQKRFAVGIKYKISKNQSVDAEFIFQREYLPGVYDSGVVSVGYNVEF